MELSAVVLLCVVSYLVGSIPTGYLVVRWSKQQDIRDQGSGNVGTMNTLHQVGIPRAVLVLAVDTAKGTLAVLVPRWLGLPEWSIYVTTVLVVAGHNWPVFLKFRGGKGVATLLGVSMAIVPILTLIALIPTAVLTALTRNIIVGVGVGLIVVNVLAFTTSQSIGQAALCLFLSVLVVGTYIVGSRGQIITAIKTRQFRGLLYGTNFNP